MNCNETARHLCDEIEMPATVQQICNKHGATTIECPNGDEENVEDVFEFLNGEYEVATEREFEELFYSFLSEGSIGIKYYDDRGDNPMFTEEDVTVGI